MKARTKIVAGAFRLLREALGDTQEDMAKRLGMSHSGWQKYEYGTSRPRGAALKAVLALCDECPEPERMRALFAAPAADGKENVGEAGDMDARMARIRRTWIEDMDFLLRMEQGGSRAAAELRQQMLATLARSASIAAMPDRQKTRRVGLVQQLIKELRGGDV